jgi:hypothetical protein
MCECEKVYTGQMGQSIVKTCKEHGQYPPLYQLDKSRVEEHNTESGHWIKFHETEMLAKTSGYIDRFVTASTEIKLHLNNINREEGFIHSKAWNPSNRLLRHSNAHTSEKSQEDKHREEITP